MRLATLFLCAALGLNIGVAGQGAHQPYKPKTGETVLELDIESRGEIFILLHAKEAPKATEHVEELVRKGFYNGQRFFKVIKSPRPYLVQTGDPASATSTDSPGIGEGGSGTTVPFENSGLSNTRGQVALATRNGDKNTGDSQFYILLGDYPRLLDGSATVFGTVVDGMDVVDRIELGDRISATKLLNG